MCKRVLLNNIFHIKIYAKIFNFSNEKYFYKILSNKNEKNKEVILKNLHTYYRYNII